MHNLQPKFAQKCLRIQQDDPRLTRLSTPWFADPEFYMLLGESLRSNTHLTKLHLRNLVVNETAAQALAEGIAQSQIKVLECEGSILEQQPSQLLPIIRRTTKKRTTGTIRRILFRGIQSSSAMESIRFIRFPIHERNFYDLADCLSMLHSLQSLSICGFHHNIQQVDGSRCYPYAQLVADVLIRSTSLKRLELCNGELSDERSMVLLTQGLQHNKSLHTLELNQCNIKDDGVELLVQYWPPDSAIHTLNLFRNAIGPRGAQCLLQAITHHPAMRRLDLSENDKIGYLGLELIGHVLMNPQRRPEGLRLTSLHLLGCATWQKQYDVVDSHPPSDVVVDSSSLQEDALALRKLRDDAGNAFLQGIQCNPYLQELTLFRNSFSKEIKHAIGFYASVNRKGRLLLSCSNTVAPSITLWCYILAKCQQHKVYDHSLVYFFLREQPTLVQH